MQDVASLGVANAGTIFWAMRAMHIVLEPLSDTFEACLINSDIQDIHVFFVHCWDTIGQNQGITPRLRNVAC